MSDPAADKLLKPDSLGAKALGIVGLVVGLGFGKYCGITLFIPAVAGGIAAWVLSKTLPEDRKPLTAAVAIQAGHIAWMLIAIMLAGRLGPGLDPDMTLVVGVEVILYSLALAWLVAMPSWLSAGLLIVYQVVALVVNFLTLSELAPNTMEHKGIVTTIGLRVFAGICLITGMRAISKARRAQWEGGDEPDDDQTMPT